MNGQLLDMKLKALFKRGRSKAQPDTTSNVSDLEPPQTHENNEGVVVTDLLDLHGFYPEQVPEIIFEFIHNAESLGLRSLRIIHGKGKSKLKWAVLRELERYPQIASFCDAPPEFGGWGATVVYLKKNEKQD